jgi:hypothetical protein
MFFTLLEKDDPWAAYVVIVRYDDVVSHAYFETLGEAEHYRAWIKFNLPHCLTATSPVQSLG